MIAVRFTSRLALFSLFRVTKIFMPMPKHLIDSKSLTAAVDSEDRLQQNSHLALNLSQIEIYADYYYHYNELYQSQGALIGIRLFSTKVFSESDQK